MPPQPHIHAELDEPRNALAAGRNLGSLLPEHRRPEFTERPPFRAPTPSTTEVARNRIVADCLIGQEGSDGRMERVELAQKTVLIESGHSLEYVYFPETAVIAFLNGKGNTALMEVATVGREGVVGLQCFLGTEFPSLRAIVKVRGTALRMSAANFRSWAATHTVLHSQLLSYTGAFIAQLTQTATCNAVHLVEERCARWLLLVQDRSGSNEVEVTHDFLASLLGVRRAGITTAMNSLKERRLLSYSRGRITVTNRPGLERVTCACYHHMRTAEERLSTRQILSGGFQGVRPTADA